MGSSLASLLPFLKILLIFASLIHSNIFGKVRAVLILFPLLKLGFVGIYVPANSGDPVFKMEKAENPAIPFIPSLFPLTASSLLMLPTTTSHGFVPGINKVATLCFALAATGPVHEVEVRVGSLAYLWISARLISIQATSEVAAAREKSLRSPLGRMDVLHHLAPFL